MAGFRERIKKLDPVFSTFDSLQTLQVNLGNLCNLQCTHCHVGASPSGTRVMGREVMEKIIGFLRQNTDVTLDITGGCPEMNPHFRYLVEETADLSPRRIVRSNLTIILEKGMEWLPCFFQEHRLMVTASLPCYLEENVDRQRGKGVFQDSIEALKILNRHGYGDSLELNLVYNPGGDYLPAPQGHLEQAYKAQLFDRYGIQFNKLFTIANAPVGRFGEYLQERGRYDRYLDLLSSHFNRETAPHIMCRTMISIDWQGILYNCDFNQALGLPITGPGGMPMGINDLETAVRKGNELVLGQHCYCCTAGEGSSCSGSLAA
jgi:radical SAM/Cys-rich protein